MKTFKQFLTEREDLYKITNDELNKSLGRDDDHDNNIRINKKQIKFLQKHLPACPKAKKNTSLIATLSKSKDFSKVNYVIPKTEK
jgi:hypothetical protein